MTNQLDLVTVVRNMLADVREKTTQLADAQTALELSRARLVTSQKDLSDHIKTVNDLATEINSELSFTTLPKVEEEVVADSLKTVESAEDETLDEAVEPAKTAASDESPVSEEDDTDEDVEPAPKAVPKAAPSSKKAAVSEKPEPAKKAPVVSGLWDDDDDEVF